MKFLASGRQVNIVDSFVNTLGISRWKAWQL
jgi:hypothetical protein